MGTVAGERCRTNANLSGKGRAGMDRWLAISDGANAALHAMAFAAARGQPASTRAVAEAIGVSPSYLAKLIQELARAGIAEMARGASGGFSVVGDPRDLSALDVLVAIDGALPKRHCLFSQVSCASGCCAVRTLCDEVGEKAEAVLKATSVADLAVCFKPKVKTRTRPAEPAARK
jgi:Rrf2 family protein